MLAYAQKKAQDEGDCWLHFKHSEDEGFTVADETEHIQELEKQ